MKSINTNNLGKYMLHHEDGTFYLMKSKGHVVITAERAKLWLEAGVHLFEGDRELMIKAINTATEN